MFDYFHYECFFILFHFLILKNSLNIGYILKKNEILFYYNSS